MRDEKEREPAHAAPSPKTHYARMNGTGEVSAVGGDASEYINPDTQASWPAAGGSGGDSRVPGDRPRVPAGGLRPGARGAAQVVLVPRTDAAAAAADLALFQPPARAVEGVEAALDRSLR